MNVGLVTGSSIPSDRQAPRTSVVLPAPSSPRTRTTSPGRRSRGEQRHRTPRSRPPTIVMRSITAQKRPSWTVTAATASASARCSGPCSRRTDRRRRGAASAGRGGPGAARSRPPAPSASTACRGPRRGGRAGRGRPSVAPSVTSCSCPCTRVIPNDRPERSFVAKFPSVATTRGRTSSIWRNRCGSQAAISASSGSRFCGGLHLSTFAR